MTQNGSTLQNLIGRAIILDTAGPTTFLGTLEEIQPEGFWLIDADIRDRTEGHVTKEKYVCEAREHGIHANRARLFVFKHVVISISELEDVVID